MKSLVLTGALSAVHLLAATPALACPGPFAERYLLWPEQPGLAPGEVAIELDLRDFAETYKTRDRYFPQYKTEASFAAATQIETIEVRREGWGCYVEIASGEFIKMFLVGRLTRNEKGALQLLPRYMTYDDPIRVRASQLAERAVDPD